MSKLIWYITDASGNKYIIIGKLKILIKKTTLDWKRIIEIAAKCVLVIIK